MTEENTCQLNMSAVFSQVRIPGSLGAAEKEVQGTENIHFWIERLNSTVNVLHVSLIESLGLRLTPISYFETCCRRASKGW